METNSQITTYAIDVEGLDREAVAGSCHALIDALAPVMSSGFIDGYSDFSPDQIDGAGSAALELIRERARSRAAGKSFRDVSNLAGIDLDLTKDEDLLILRDFGPWTIHTEIYSESRMPSQGADILCFHDSGYSITAELTESEASDVEAALPSGATIRRLEPRKRWSLFGRQGPPCQR